MKEVSATPPITVFMPVYNTQSYLKEAIESILAQTFTNFEFLIINDHSTDKSLDIIQDYAARDKRIRVVNHSGNRGIVESSNEAIALAKGEFLARMDSDDISPLDRLERQYTFLKNHPDYVCVGCKTLLISPDGDPLTTFPFFETHEEIIQAMMRGINPAMMNPSVMMKVEALMQIGGYCQEYYAAEDFDCFLKLAEVGKLANLPEVLFKYRQHLSSIGHKEREKQKSNFLKSLEEAHKRRNLTFDREYFEKELSHENPNHFQKWAWWALISGNKAVARKYAFKALLQHPFSKESWRIFLCSLRGY